MNVSMAMSPEDIHTVVRVLESWDGWFQDTRETATEEELAFIERIKNKYQQFLVGTPYEVKK